MKRTLLFPIAALALSALLTAPGFAQNPNTEGAGPGAHDGVPSAPAVGVLGRDPGHPRVNQVNRREQRQQERIAEGVRSGELTPRETRQLERQQGRIERQERRDMARHNGHLTAGEQARLNREQNRASRNIYAKKHNRAVR